MSSCACCIVVSAGKLRKLWDSLSELRGFLCESRLERTVLGPALLPVKTAQVLCVKVDWKDSSEACAIACQNFAVYSVFPSGMTLSRSPSYRLKTSPPAVPQCGSNDVEPTLIPISIYEHRLVTSFRRVCDRQASEVSCFSAAELDCCWI